MRKQLLLLAGCLLALSAQAQTVTKKVDVSRFSGISASSVYHITLEKAATCSVEITYDKRYADAIEVGVFGSNLEMKLNHELLKDRGLNNNMPPIRAIVKMPELNRLDLSGASSLTTSSSFSADNGFDGQLSGASSATGLNLIGKGRISLTTSGASSVSMVATAGSGTFGLSGASKLSLTYTGETLRVDCSGAATAQVNADCTDAGLEVSGAAKINAIGGTDRLRVQCSGASRIDTHAMRAQNVDAEVSGVSGADVSAEKHLSASASGPSSIVYSGNAEVAIGSVSKMSSVKKR